MTGNGVDITVYKCVKMPLHLNYIQLKAVSSFTVTLIKYIFLKN